MRTMSRRCVLLFSRAPRAEARAKRVARAERIFDLARRRVAAATASLDGVDLLVVGTAIPGARRLVQRGKGFGERLSNAFADARDLGYREIVVVPGDVPGLSASHLAAAFTALEAQPTVLGPSPDGGVYLIGARRPVDRLFDGVRWCTGSVLADLRAQAGAAALLPPLADLDRASDLRRLERDPALDPPVRRLVREIRRPALPRPSSGPPIRSRFASPPDAQRGPPAAA
jgi:glycosyltransferase A (GT-A) superfamily protein (DUF2064 family)